MSSDPGCEFSFASLLFLLPPPAFAAISNVVSTVPTTLAPPFICQLLLRDYGIHVEFQTVENVLWKLGGYLPSSLAQTHDNGINDPRLKDLQGLAAELNTVALPPLRSRCPYGVPSEGPRPHQGGAASDYRALLSGFSLSAGIQYASFQESYWAVGNTRKTIARQV